MSFETTPVATKGKGDLLPIAEISSQTNRINFHWPDIFPASGNKVKSLRHSLVQILYNQGDEHGIRQGSRDGTGRLTDQIVSMRFVMFNPPGNREFILISPLIRRTTFMTFDSSRQFGSYLSTGPGVLTNTVRLSSLLHRKAMPTMIHTLGPMSAGHFSWHNQMISSSEISRSRPASIFRGTDSWIRK